jgi:hypothetical protein
MMNSKYSRIKMTTYIKHVINNSAAKGKNKAQAHSFFALRMSLFRDSKQNIRYKISPFNVSYRKRILNVLSWKAAGFQWDEKEIIMLKGWIKICLVKTRMLISRTFRFVESVMSKSKNKQKRGGKNPFWCNIRITIDIFAVMEKLIQ